MRHNDIDLKQWREANINVDSLWIIPQRDKSGKHKNVYHGNFVPQIPRELISRYTKKGEIVLDAFLGSGTSLYETQSLGRKCIGMDINPNILEYVKSQMVGENCSSEYYFGFCDNTDSFSVDYFMQEALESLGDKSVQFVILHPPYMDIVRFSENPNDLSHLSNLENFIQVFLKSCKNTLKFLDIGRYFAVVIGDVYKQSEVKPLGFYVMDKIKRNFSVKLKGIIIKNIEGNRGKLKTQNIWQYRAISSDYYLFKHEYIFVFKKEK